MGLRNFGTSQAYIAKMQEPALQKLPALAVTSLPPRSSHFAEPTKGPHALHRIKGSDRVAGRVVLTPEVAN
jgi:hypothetical protein